MNNTNKIYGCIDTVVSNDITTITTADGAKMVISNDAIENCCIYKGDLIEDEIEKQLKNIEKEYENKLQREKVHLSRSTGVKGHRIYGRRYHVAIQKGHFRNQKRISSMPSKT